MQSAGAGLSAAGSPPPAQRLQPASSPPLPSRGSNPWEDVSNAVVLKIEYMDDRTTRVLLLQFRTALAVALGLLAWEAAVKFGEPDSELIHNGSLVTANLVVASACLTAALAMAARLLFHVWRVNRAGKAWSARRRRTVALFGCELGVQALGLAFFLAPNALVAAQPCSWFLTPVYVCSCLRWSCWNTLFCLFVVQAHNPMPAQLRGPALLRLAATNLRKAAAGACSRWASLQRCLAGRTRPGAGRGGQPSVQEAAGGAGVSEGAPLDAPEGKCGVGTPGGDDGDDVAAEGAPLRAEPMVVDLPLRSHVYKALLLWLPCQVAIVSVLAYQLRYGYNGGPPCASLSDTRCFPEAASGTQGCESWQYSCNLAGVPRALTYLTSALLLLTLAAYFALLAVAQRQLAARPYCVYRVGNILLRVQFQTRLLAAAFFVLCNLLLWWVDQRPCASYMDTWLGLTPMEIVMTSLVLVNCVCVLPSDPDRRQLELHAWLQDFAWREADLPRKLAQRPGQRREPMFCVETALKMLCWCWVVYDDHGGANDDDDDDVAQMEEAKGNLPATPATPPAGGSAHSAAAPANPSGASEGLPEQRPPAAADAAAAESGEAASLGGCGSGCGRCEPAGQELGLGTALALCGLTHSCVLWGPGHDAKCVLGWADGGDTIVCCFRGTVSLRNMLANMKVWRAPHPPVRGAYWLCRRPMVHWGFLATWLSSGLNAAVLAQLRRLLERPPPPGGRPWRLIMTGHSLGGALASLAALDARALCAELAAARGLAGGADALARLEVLTFATPRPGNHAFAREYAAAVPHSFDVVHPDDTVTRGGKFLFLYKRAAHRVMLTPSGDLLVRPSFMERSALESFATSLQQHPLTAYARSLGALVRGQFERQKEHNGGRRACAELLRCRHLQQVLRATAGVRHESLARLRRLRSAAGRLATPGGDQHLADGGWLAAPPARPTRRFSVLAGLTRAKLSPQASALPRSASSRAPAAAPQPAASRWTLPKAEPPQATAPLMERAAADVV